MSSNDSWMDDLDEVVPDSDAPARVTGVQLRPGEGVREFTTWDEAQVALSLDAPDAPMYEFVTGVAGSGKTYAQRERVRTRRDTLLCATTGIAAVNLGGTTINAALGYFDTPSLKEKFFAMEVDRKLRHLRDERGIRRIILDEVSMLDAEQLTYIAAAIHDINERPVARGQRDQIMRLTLTGDFAQLPPIKSEFAFTAPEWEAFERHTIKLTRQRRQADPAFVEALNHVRRGDAEAAAEYFAPLFHAARDDHFDGCTILATNAEVDRYNTHRLRALPGEVIRWTAKREGRQRGEWKGIPEVLELKIGATVMVLANDRRAAPGTGRQGYRYVNGDIGTIVGVVEDDDQLEYHERGDEYIGEMGDPLVQLHRTDEVRVVSKVVRTFAVTGEAENARLQKKWGLLTKEELAEGRLITDLTIAELQERLGPERLKEYLAEREGFIEYTPIRLAYASTVHRSQGLSLDHVQIALTGAFFSSPGMSYVALSRARGVEGLRLVCPSREMFVSRCNVDERVRRFL